MGSEREFKKIGGGHETDVFASSRGSRESGVVIKEYGGYGGSVNQEKRVAMERYYARLRSVYGDIIPRQRFMKDMYDPDTFILVQKKVRTAEKPNLMDYDNDELEPHTQKQLDRLIETLREQYRLFKEDRDAVDAYTLLDFAKKDNLLVDDEGNIRYVDTGVLQKYSRFDNRDVIHLIEGPLALLELVSGKDGDDIMNDPVYENLVQNYRRTESIDRKEYAPKRLEDFIRGRYDLRGKIL